MKNLIFLLSILLVIAFTSPTFAASFKVFDVTTDPHTADINQWVANNGGQITVSEDFEDFSSGWHDTLDTDVGTFTAGGAAGTGSSSYKQIETPSDPDTPHFSIQTGGTKWGRHDTTYNNSTGTWLDSADIT